MKNATSTKKAKAGTKSTAKKVKAGTATAARKPAKAGSSGKPATYVDGKSLAWYMNPKESTAGKKKLAAGKSRRKSPTREDLNYRLRMAKFLRVMRENAGDLDKESRPTRFDQLEQELASVRAELAEIKELLTTPRPLIVTTPRNLTDKLPVKLPFFNIDATAGSKKGSGAATKARKYK